MFEMKGRLRLPVVIGLWALCLLPYLYLIVLSVSGSWTFPHLVPGEWRPGRWVRFVTGNNDVASSFVVSVGISLAVALLSTPVGFFAAKHIAYHRKPGPRLFLAYAPYAFSPVILGTCVMFAYLKLGLTGHAGGVVLAQSMFGLAFAIVFFVPFWNTEKKSLEELVYTLGGTRKQAFVMVLWPVSKGMILICFFQTFLISWTQYGLTLLIGSGKVQTLPLKVFEYVNEANPFYAALAACLLILPPAGLVWLNKRFVFSGD